MPEDFVVDLEADFKPNIVNTVVYLISTSMQVSTFAINYRGYPFTQRLTENKVLFYALVFSFLFVFAAAADVSPDLSEMVELVPLPNDEFKDTLLLILIGDFGVCYVVEQICRLFGS
eukprot:GFYU01001542.1.p1 GENE.GFYU01001542.1~~GFYU01001542.1.p1  ORF type:complete len:117 (-),score=34.87 GFYU01001542.1:123-473(-)